ncbi:MAG: colicin V production protein [Methylotenera sp.]|jgi:membrane protein required for colicin V production|uniref:Colicin V production protein n=1 Tax=Methylotenera mobilis TaxID=359408 RepID=A0A351RCU4_9PROT|nr:MAG: colicin V production protein [Methylotenera sp.]PPD46918.1 MAG: colicin V production protein [Methylotenera sp.]HBA09865.1 colicin V production protein [Methylotenera mobilis]
MTIFDYIVLIIIGLSVILSVMRGMIREVLAIVGLVAAFYVGVTYTNQLLPMMPIDIPNDALRVLAAFLVLFLATLLLATLLGIALSAIFKKAGLGWLNRFLGALFGVARGLLIVCVIVFLAGLTDIPKDSRWRNAMFSAPIEALVLSLLPWVPESIAKHVKYD